MKQDELIRHYGSSALVSVIIPCFNHARFLPDSVASVQTQTHPNWECIIINDGSTDDTAAVAERLVEEEKRIKAVHQENRGLSGARNRGLEIARGAYIQFLDADDMISPKKIELQLEVLSGAKQLGLAYSDYRYCDRDDPNKTVTRDRFAPPRFKMHRPILDIASRWETEFSIPVHAFLFDARFFKEHGIRFDESLPNHEDWDCWMRIFALDPIIFNIPEQLAIYRLHNDSMCSNAQQMLSGFCKALEKQIALGEEDRELNATLRNKHLYMKRLYRDVKRRSRLEKLRTDIHLLCDQNVTIPIQRIVSYMSQFFFRKNQTPGKDKQ
jgi:glycosyltransferase involved in cell wall biosynthesis